MPETYTIQRNYLQGILEHSSALFIVLEAAAKESPDGLQKLMLEGAMKRAEVVARQLQDVWNEPYIAK